MFLPDSCSSKWSLRYNYHNYHLQVLQTPNITTGYAGLQKHFVQYYDDTKKLLLLLLLPRQEAPAESGWPAGRSPLWRFFFSFTAVVKKAWKHTLACVTRCRFSLMMYKYGLSNAHQHVYRSTWNCQREPQITQQAQVRRLLQYIYIFPSAWARHCLDSIICIYGAADRLLFWWDERKES